MERDQSNQTDVTINNIMILAHDKNESRNSENATTSLTSNISNVADTVINNKKDMIRIEINKEMDKLFGPALERTKSGSDIGVAAPLKQKRRQCRSQEVLTSERPIIENKISGSSDAGLNVYQFQDSKNENDTNTPQVSILYDNQRAEIIASVTERLYNKLKRNERPISKMESIVDKKIMQPLTELKICSNARQRLVELSQKAIRTKRKIGIPAATQTKKHAIRVKNQEIDIQTDLQPYCNHRNRSCIFQRDISTETLSLAPRYKDIAVGSKFGCLNGSDRSTITESIKKSFKDAYTMTDSIEKQDRTSQTYVLPPPRRKKRKSMLSKYLKRTESFRSILYDTAVSPTININISPVYSVDSHSSDDQSVASVSPKIKDRLMIPDLCKGHNSLEEIKNTNSNNMESSSMKAKTNASEFTIKQNDLGNKSDFSDEESSILPRVTIDPMRKVSCKDYEDLILGRDGYPYNIELSPCKENTEEKKMIKFKDIDVTPAECCSIEWLEKQNEGSNLSKIINKKDLTPDGAIKIDKSLDYSDKEEYYNICNDMENTKTNFCIHNESKTAKVLYKRRCFKNSLNENEVLKTYHRRSSSSCEHVFDQLKKIEDKQEPTCSLDYLVNGNNHTIYNVRNTNSTSEIKLTPTEYLKQLIQIRRDAVTAVNKNHQIQEFNK